MAQDFLVFVFSSRLVLALRLTVLSGASLSLLSHAAHVATPAARPNFSFQTLLLAGIIRFDALRNIAHYWLLVAGWVWACLRGENVDEGHLAHRRGPLWPSAGVTSIWLTIITSVS